jgi:hypothetical protein
MIGSFGKRPKLGNSDFCFQPAPKAHSVGHVLISQFLLFRQTAEESRARPLIIGPSTFLVGIGDSRPHGQRRSVRGGTPGSMECGGLLPLCSSQFAPAPKAGVPTSRHTPNWLCSSLRFPTRIEFSPTRAVEEPPFLTKAQTCKALPHKAALGIDAFGDQMYSQFPSVMGQLIVP